MPSEERQSVSTGRVTPVKLYSIFIPAIFKQEKAILQARRKVGTYTRLVHYFMLSQRNQRTDKTHAMTAMRLQLFAFQTKNKKKTLRHVKKTPAN